MKPNLKEWLVKKKATPTEVKIFLLANRAVKGNKVSFQNSDIQKTHGTSWQNIRQNLARMIDKGMIKRVSYQQYAPAKTF